MWAEIDAVAQFDAELCLNAFFVRVYQHRCPVAHRQTQMSRATRPLSQRRRCIGHTKAEFAICATLHDRKVESGVVLATLTMHFFLFQSLKSSASFLVVSDTVEHQLKHVVTTITKGMRWSGVAP